MLDLKFVRENPEVVKQNIRNKFQDEKLPAELLFSVHLTQLLHLLKEASHPETYYGCSVLQPRIFSNVFSKS